MRRIIFLLLPALLFATSVEAGICRRVKWQSFGNIGCHREIHTMVITYSSQWAYDQVEGRDKRIPLIRALCLERQITNVKEVVLESEGERIIITKCTTVSP